MEPEGSLPCSQGPSASLYPEPDQSSPYHPILVYVTFKKRLDFHIFTRTKILQYISNLTNDMYLMMASYGRNVL
jgi:hypothetical protein